MKKYSIFYLLAMMMAFAFVSCSEKNDEEHEFENWQKRNNEFFSKIHAEAVENSDGQWKVLRKWSLNDDVKADITDDVVVKVISSGKGDTSPIYTDTASVAFCGRLIPSNSYPEGYVFKSMWSDEYDINRLAPMPMAVSNTLFGEGLTTVLQKMHKGDRWLVYIPYQLAYGEREQPSIPAYSTLILDLTLLGYHHVGEIPPPFKIRRANK